MNRIRKGDQIVVITGKDKGVTMAQMEKGKTCGACHNGRIAFRHNGNCDKCHKM